MFLCARVPLHRCTPLMPMCCPGRQAVRRVLLDHQAVSRRARSLSRPPEGTAPTIFVGPFPNRYDASTLAELPPNVRRRHKILWPEGCLFVFVCRALTAAFDRIAANDRPNPLHEWPGRTPVTRGIQRAQTAYYRSVHLSCVRAVGVPPCPPPPTCLPACSPVWHTCIIYAACTQRTCTIYGRLAWPGLPLHAQMCACPRACFPASDGG